MSSVIEHARTLNNSVVFGNPLKHHNKIDIIHITWKLSFGSAIFTNIFVGSPLQIDFAILFCFGFQENFGKTCLNNINLALKTLHHPPDLVCGTLWSFRLSPQVTFARVWGEKESCGLHGISLPARCVNKNPLFARTYHLFPFSIAYFCFELSFSFTARPFFR